MQPADQRARDLALRFVEAHGCELARRRARALAGAAPASEVAAALAARQRDDGGFAADAGPDAPARLCAARAALAALVDVGVRHGPVVERTCAWLVRAQRQDGRWAPEGDASEAAALEATGCIAGLLARTACVRASRLEAAADWLAERFAPERVQGSAWDALRAFAAAFASVPHDGGDGILQWCGRELERGFRAGAFDAVRTARVLVDCDAPSLPGARLAPAELRAALLAAQAEDGGFPAPRGVAGDAVERTLDALAALARWAR
jgi:hypothetical protein